MILFLLKVFHKGSWLLSGLQLTTSLDYLARRKNLPPLPSENVLYVCNFATKRTFLSSVQADFRCDFLSFFLILDLESVLLLRSFLCKLFRLYSLDRLLEQFCNCHFGLITSIILATANTWTLLPTGVLCETLWNNVKFLKKVENLFFSVAIFKNICHFYHHLKERFQSHLSL